MLNLKLFWILIIFLIGGCTAEAAVTEATTLDNPSIPSEEVVLATAVAVTKQVSPTSSPVPTATDEEMGVVMDTAVAPTPANTSSTTNQPTQTPIHPTPILPKTTRPNPGDKLDTFLVRSLNAGTGTSFEDLAVERSKQHLSQKLQVPIAEITLASIDRAELDNNNICQSPTNAGKAIENHGTTLGYEILLSTNNQTYRYVIAHNLGYYCAN